MCRSSRILWFLSLCLVPALVFAPMSAQARGLSIRLGASFGSRPSVIMPRAAIRPGLRPGIRPGVFGGLRGPGRFGRFGRGGFGFGGYDAAGLGLSLVGDLGAAPALPDDGYGPEPQPQPPYVPAARPQCVKPLIISIGHGLRRAVRTRVVYGAPTPCGS